MIRFSGDRLYVRLCTCVSVCARVSKNLIVGGKERAGALWRVSREINIETHIQALTHRRERRVNTATHTHAHTVFLVDLCAV